ncbi:hypothetical protein [Rhizomonospora bruguierae]|uniref:hypothetical protein n=1 Tax=Rhizomonospora bruguierae TaxID=1581705 RepID=UPI001BCAD490|nr:hypothetical protein [Micromonospora sp. NBRC 107566]
MSEWISTADTAARLGVSESTVYRSLAAGPEVADQTWGADNWRRRPHIRRTIYQLRAVHIDQLAAGDGSPVTD